MLYVTSSPISLVTYHINQQYNQKSEVYRGVNERVLSEILMKGTIICPAFCVATLKTKKPPKDLYQSQFNTCYLCVEDLEAWTNFIEQKDWIKQVTVSPELYKTPLNKLKALFEPDAFDWFWQQFKYTPLKLEMELTKLLIQFGADQQKVSVPSLERLYGRAESNLFYEFPKHLGDQRGTEILRQLSNSDLWSLLVGSEKKPPRLYYYLVGSRKSKGICPELHQYLEQVQVSIKAGNIETRIALIVFNQWLISVGIDKSNKYRWEFRPQIEDQIQLQKLLEGYE